MLHTPSHTSELTTGMLKGRLIFGPSFRFQIVELLEFQEFTDVVFLGTVVCSQAGILEVLGGRIFNFHFQQSLSKTDQR